MIREANGDLLGADVDAVVNTVNTVGVMGKGIALQFKRAYPTMFREYARLCKGGLIQLGTVHVWSTELMQPRFVINFPTKGHWRAGSKIADIRTGLNSLVQVIREHNITSIALPPLGCGNGGLNWDDVEPLIREAFAALPDVDVVVFPPAGAPAARAMATATPKPNMTPARAVLIQLLARYAARSDGASLIEVQKLLYLLQEAGEELKLDYVAARYGPYADNLRHALQALEGHFITGFGDGSARVLEAEPISLLEGADEAAGVALNDSSLTLDRMDRVLELTEGYESAYGLELLATVHWAMVHDGLTTVEDVVERVQGWNARKADLFTPNHIAHAASALRRHGWVTSAA